MLTVLAAPPALSGPLRARSANKRLFLLDYDGTLIPASSINSRPTAEVLAVLKALAADARNVVYIISGRGRSELGDWFESVVRARWGRAGLRECAARPDRLQLDRAVLRPAMFTF